MITPSVVSERLKIRGSLARFALQELETKGLIRLVDKHHAQIIYTRNTKAEDEDEAAAAAAATAKSSGLFFSLVLFPPNKYCICVLEGNYSGLPLVTAPYNESAGLASLDSFYHLSSRKMISTRTRGMCPWPLFLS